MWILKKILFAGEDNLEIGSLGARALVAPGVAIVLALLVRGALHPVAVNGLICKDTQRDALIIQEAREADGRCVSFYLDTFALNAF